MYRKHRKCGPFRDKSFYVQSPVKYLNLDFLSLCVKGTIVTGTLFGNLLEKGIYRMHYTINNNHINLSNFNTYNGHIDSIGDMLFHGNFIKLILVNIYCPYIIGIHVD